MHIRIALWTLIITKANVMSETISSIRLAPDNATVLKQLGLLGDLAGTWTGRGFNLIGRPDFHNKENVYLQLNETLERLQIDPIGSPIPNRGFGQDDINLFGLTYLQRISDAHHGGALHIEPGLWVTQPNTTYPGEDAPASEQIVGRMGSIPHGNAILAQGLAAEFKGPPVLKTGAVEYAFSRFPSFNSTPFPVPALPALPVVNADGSSEKLTAAAAGVPPFGSYDLTINGIPPNARTPFGTTEPPLPPAIDGVAMQNVINDPIRLLQQTIESQVREGHEFEGVVLNIASQRKITFFNAPNSAPNAATNSVEVPTFAGGIENIQFLEGGEPTGTKGPNAETALVYATFWIEKVSHKDRPSFMQLQYAQMVVLNFGILTALNAPPNRLILIGWPHISVATLRKTFN